MSEIRAFDPSRVDNDRLMADCLALGYLLDPVLDATYGEGKWWTLHRPPSLVANDLDPAKGDVHHDFRDLPYDPESFGTVALDPPYKLTGTATRDGHHGALNDSFGVRGRYADHTPDVVRGWYFDGIAEAARILRRRGHALVKCQDQISSGRYWEQTRWVSEAADKAGLTLVDKLFVLSGRAQPSGRRQVHARNGYSTLVVLRK